MGFFIFRCQRSAFYANERMRATSDATTPRKGEIQPNFSRFQAFLRVFHRVENEAHSMQINECTDTTTLPERLKKRKNTAKLFPDLKCISPREREREISKMIRTPWKKKLSNSIRRIIKWITNFLIKVGIKGGIKPDKCALACLVRWSALKYTTNRRGKDLENGPPSIRNLAQVVLLLSTYYSKLLFEGRFGIISNIGRERKGIFAEQFGTFIDRFCLATASTRTDHVSSAFPELWSANPRLQSCEKDARNGGTRLAADDGNASK